MKHYVVSIVENVRVNYEVEADSEQVAIDKVVNGEFALMELGEPEEGMLLDRPIHCGEGRLSTPHRLEDNVVYLWGVEK